MLIPLKSNMEDKFVHLQFYLSTFSNISILKIRTEIQYFKFISLAIRQWHQPVDI